MSKIVINSDICNGRPAIEGTRIAAQTILEFLAAGDSVEDILEEYPKLKREDIYACINYAGQLLSHNFDVRIIPPHNNGIRP